MVAGPFFVDQPGGEEREQLLLHVLGRGGLVAEQPAGDHREGAAGDVVGSDAGSRCAGTVARIVPSACSAKASCTARCASVVVRLPRTPA